MEKTEQFTEFIGKNNLHSIFSIASAQFIEEIDSLKHDENFDVVNIASGYNVINYVAVKNEWKDIVRKMYLQCFLKSEQIVAGSGVFSCYVMSKYLQGYNFGETKYYNKKVKQGLKH